MISSIHNTNSISEQPKTLSPHLDYVVHSNVSLFLPQQVVYKILQLGIGELECVAAIVIPEDKVVGLHFNHHAGIFVSMENLFEKIQTWMDWVVLLKLF